MQNDGQRQRQPRTVRWRGHGVQLTIVAVLGVVFSFIPFVLLRRMEQATFRREFMADAERVVRAIEDAITHRILAIEMLQAFFYASKQVTRDEFAIATERYFQGITGMRSLQWVPRVPRAERMAYEVAARREGLEHFQITEQNAQGKIVRASHRDEYFPVYFLEPHSSNGEALGYDLGSEPTRLAALEKARDTNRVVATKPITLIQEGKPLVGFLIIAPVYNQEGNSDTVEGRRESLTGFVIGVFEVPELVDPVLASFDPAGIDIRVYDETDSHAVELLYAHGSRTRNVDNRPQRLPLESDGICYAKTFDVAERKWDFVCTPAPVFYSAHYTKYPWGVLTGGLLFAGLLTLYLRMQFTRTTEIETQVEQRTVALKQAIESLYSEVKERTRAEEQASVFRKFVETSEQGFGMARLDRRAVYINQTLSRLLGEKRPSDAYGKDFACYYLEEDREELEKTVVPTILDKGYCRAALRLLSVQGHVTPAIESFFVIRDDHGKPAYIAVVITDITELKRAEEELERHRDHLEDLVAERAAELVAANEELRQEIVERKRAEATLARLTAIVEMTSDLVAIATPDFQLTYVNRAGRKLVGWNLMEDLSEKVIRDLYPGWVLDLLRREGVPTATREGVWEGETAIYGADGREVPVSQVIMSHATADGHPEYLSTIARDVTKQKQAAKEREELITKLETQNAELERFTYTVSHDLKAPLITLQGHLGLLREDLANSNIDAIKEDIWHMTGAAERMAELLSDLLELSRIGRLVNPPEDVPLDALAREAGTIVAGQIAQRGVQITIADDLPILFGDRARLLEVMQNLIDNGVKYMGDQPEPRIEIGVEHRDGETLCYVRDNGMGIEPIYFDKVFGLFQQLDRSTEGSGVGLALVKRIIEVHGGRIWVESAGKGLGTTLFFTLPEKDAKAEERDA